MNYFVNENIFTLNSGTEFSAIKRLRMFNDNGVPAKILTRNYNSQLAGDLGRVGLTHKNAINMYDYFQDITDTAEKDVDVRYSNAIDKYKYHIEGIDANESLIKYHGDTIAKVLIAPATVGLIGSIEYYNEMGVVVAKDYWDRRGFKSSTQYFHPDGNLGPQIFFDRNGKPKLEITHMNINNVLMPTMYKLLDYKGKVWRFNTEEELFVFFMSELAAKEPTVFINDRPSLVPAVASVEGAVGKWQYLHNVHSVNNEQKSASHKLLDYLQPLFNKFVNGFDGILVATEQQKEEIQKMHHFKQVVALPDTFAEKIKLDAVDRDTNKIIYLGRIADDKGTLDTIQILSRVHQKVPKARLEFYGYASPADVQNKLSELAEKDGLKEFVIYKGYQAPAEIEKALKTAAVLLSTATGEGFGMNLLEAMSVGVPIVAYDVKYGLSELIDNNINGILGPSRGIQAAADSIISILTDKDKLEKMSQAAYKKAQIFDESAAWNKWKNAAATIDNLFVK